VTKEDHPNKKAAEDHRPQQEQELTEDEYFARLEAAQWVLTEDGRLNFLGDEEIGQCDFLESENEPRMWAEIVRLPLPETPDDCEEWLDPVCDPRLVALLSAKKRELCAEADALEKRGPMEKIRIFYEAAAQLASRRDADLIKLAAGFGGKLARRERYQDEHSMLFAFDDPAKARLFHDAAKAQGLVGERKPEEPVFEG